MKDPKRSTCKQAKERMQQKDSTGVIVLWRPHGVIDREYPDFDLAIIQEP